MVQMCTNTLPHHHHAYFSFDNCGRWFPKVISIFDSSDHRAVFTKTLIYYKFDYAGRRGLICHRFELFYHRFGKSQNRKQVGTTANQILKSQQPDVDAFTAHKLSQVKNTQQDVQLVSCRTDHNRAKDRPPYWFFLLKTIRPHICDLLRFVLHLVEIWKSCVC